MLNQSQTTPTVRAQDLADEAVAAIGRLRSLWTLLGDALMPGVPGTTALLERRLSPAAEAAEADAIRRDRRAAAEALRHGRVPAGPHVDAVRPGPLRARGQVAQLIRDAARHVDPSRYLGQLADPAERRPVAACPWCAGTGRALRPPGWAWNWPDQPISCSLCGGWGWCCLVCGQGRPCGCDIADLVVATSMSTLRTVLPDATDPDRVATATALLLRAERVALASLGLAETDHRIIKAPCPACGRRDLWAEVASPHPDEWSVKCRSPLCRCAGPGCGCGREVRWLGRLHRWPAREFAALAERIGVALPL